MSHSLTLQALQENSYMTSGPYADLQMQEQRLKTMSFSYLIYLIAYILFSSVRLARILIERKDSIFHQYKQEIIFITVFL